MLTIGRLADLTGVPATTLRYYDRLGLLPTTRTASGHRRYEPAAAHRLRLVRLLRAVGCSLDEVAAVLAQSDRDGGSQVRRDLADRKLREVREQQERLTAVAAVLGHLAECRHGPDETAECHALVLRLLDTALPSA